ncbi:hypothetical protein GN956_G19335 [Arapaima gigas]
MDANSSALLKVSRENQLEMMKQQAESILWPCRCGTWATELAGSRGSEGIGRVPPGRKEDQSRCWRKADLKIEEAGLF